jgi:hypothetical protein
MVAWTITPCNFSLARPELMRQKQRRLENTSFAMQFTTCTSFAKVSRVWFMRFLRWRRLQATMARRQWSTFCNKPWLKLRNVGFELAISTSKRNLKYFVHQLVHKKIVNSRSQVWFLDCATARWETSEKPETRDSVFWYNPLLIQLRVSGRASCRSGKGRRKSSTCLQLHETILVIVMTWMYSTTSHAKVVYETDA